MDVSHGTTHVVSSEEMLFQLRYFDWDGQVHLAKGKTGGQWQTTGGPLRDVNIQSDYIGYIKTKLSVVIQVLTELKSVFKEDASLELNVTKTSILSSHEVTHQSEFDVVHIIIADRPTLTHLRVDIALDSFWPERFVGIGVQIGTDTFVRNFVSKTCTSPILPGHPTPVYQLAYYD